MVIAASFALGVSLLPRVPVTGQLATKDLRKILQLVRPEIRREADLLPDLSWSSLRDLPSAVRRYRAEQVDSVSVLTNGTVCVRTVKDSEKSYGSEYYLERGRGGWRVTKQYWWVPSGYINDR